MFVVLFNHRFKSKGLDYFMGFGMGERVICQVLHADLFLIYKKWKSFSATSLTDKRNHDLHSSRLDRKFLLYGEKKPLVFI